MRQVEINRAVERASAEIGHQTAHLDDDEQIIAFCTLIQEWAEIVEKMIRASDKGPAAHV